MHLQNFPQWQVINKSTKKFAIQEDQQSLTIISPINDYAFAILNQIFFTIADGTVTEVTTENNSDELTIEVNQESTSITILDKD